MILDQLSFSNFGAYSGRHELVLTPPSVSKPVILIGGLNGGGKTTLLDAIQLALYGKNAQCSNRGSLPYEEFLRRSIHRGTDNKEASVELSFRRRIGGEEDSYRLVRTWMENGKGLKEAMSVFHNGKLDVALSEGWSEHSEAFVPHGIAHLFFFDGEKIENMADPANAAKALSAAIYSLLGLNIVDRLSSDLLVLERKKRQETKDDSLRQRIDEVAGELQTIDALFETAFTLRASVQNKLDQSEKAFLDLERRFHKEGGDLIQRKDQIEGQKKTAEREYLKVQLDLREIISGPLPFTLVPGLIADVCRQGEAEQAARENELLSKVLGERDAKLLEGLAGASVPDNFAKVVDRLCREDRELRKNLSRLETNLGLAPKLLGELRLLRSRILPEQQKSARKMIRAAHDVKERLTVLEKKIALIPDPEAVAGIARQMHAAELTLIEVKARWEAVNEQVIQLTAKREKKKTELTSLIESGIHEKLSRDTGDRVLVHAGKVRNTLRTFRLQMVSRHVARIEGLILESLLQLLRKTSLISGIKINPENFEMELQDGAGRALSPDRLSAGERQLLAISMLWGLAKASGRPLPTVIDTPLGRLDASHRIRLVENYFPYASHQVLLLSTDEELDQAHYSRLKTKIGRAYHLVFDDVTGSTSIHPDYFWQ